LENADLLLGDRPCHPEHVVDQFRHGGCKSICTYVDRCAIVHDRKLTCDVGRGQIPSGRYKCFVPVLAHDAVHSSAVGHAIAKHLIVHALALAERLSYEEKGIATMVQKEVMPLTTFVAEDVRQLEVRSQYLIVRDVARIFSRWDKLVPMSGSSGTVGFELYADDELKQRPGWIATNPLGKSTITLSIELPYEKEGYAVYLVILQSYKGTFHAEVSDYGDDSKKKMTQMGFWLVPSPCGVMCR